MTPLPCQALTGGASGRKRQIPARKRSRPQFCTDLRGSSTVLSPLTTTAGSTQDPWMVRLQWRFSMCEVPVAQQLRLDLYSPEHYSPEAFVASESNQRAWDAMQTPQDWISNALAIIGPEGTGKTHLAHVFADRHRAVWLEPSDPDRPDYDPLRGRLVVLDNADQADPETLFHLINLSQSDGGRLLLTARDHPVRWPSPIADLRSRLNALQVIELQKPDDHLLRVILERLFAQRAIRPSPELLAYLANRIERSVPAARTIVTELDEKSDGRAITRHLARMILDNRDEALQGALDFDDDDAAVTNPDG